MKLFVGCSSSDNIPKKYVDDCEKLLSQIFLNDYDLVFGANDTGLMGLSYCIAKRYHRKVIGVCPFIYKSDLKKLDCDLEHVSNTALDRTNDAIGFSDAILFLPGGIGTFCEFFASLESKRSHEHNKPIILYNCHGYYDELLILLDRVYKEKFTNVKVQESYYIANNPQDVINYLKCLKK